MSFHSDCPNMVGAPVDDFGVCDFMCPHTDQTCKDDDIYDEKSGMKTNLHHGANLHAHAHANPLNSISMQIDKGVQTNQHCHADPHANANHVKRMMMMMMMMIMMSMIPNPHQM